MTVNTRPAVRDHIFISYRRDDARGASGRLYDWLRIGFGRERVFRDVHSIGVGKWRDKIDEALARSSVCIAVIGRVGQTPTTCLGFMTKTTWYATSS